MSVYKHAMSHNMRTEDVTVEVRYVRRYVVLCSVLFLLYVALNLLHAELLLLRPDGVRFIHCCLKS